MRAVNQFRGRPNHLCCNLYILFHYFFKHCFTVHSFSMITSCMTPHAIINVMRSQMRLGSESEYNIIRNARQCRHRILPSTISQLEFILYNSYILANISQFVLWQQVSSIRGSSIIEDYISYKIAQNQHFALDPMIDSISMALFSNDCKN